ncbi:hypothetical protein NITLEN_30356 [Nitrospira lenta]|uniref:Uncharacterized protein n=1 Tax=Nitrospira lenta TaxID=1436998 RepID=A0A330L6E6_9BACT|nr:hypothetical protein NITLEN_30356 [Nitrospira lenta]
MLNDHFEHPAKELFPSMFMRTRVVKGNTLFHSLFHRPDGCGHRSRVSILPLTNYKDVIPLWC